MCGLCVCVCDGVGPRVADELIKLVPNLKTYRLALCAIKLWAQRKFQHLKKRKEKKRKM